MQRATEAQQSQEMQRGGRSNASFSSEKEKENNPSNVRSSIELIGKTDLSELSA